MKGLDSYAAQLELKLKVSLDFPVVVEVGGGEWVVNISPSGVELPGRVKKLIGVKPRSNDVLISVAKSVFSQCGLTHESRFFGTAFSEEGSYMMLRVSSPLDPADIAPVVSEWLSRYVGTRGV